MNKFELLKTAQKHVNQVKPGFWTLTVEHKTVSNIVKAAPGVYLVTLNSTQHRSFMAALSSLLDNFETMLNSFEEVKVVEFCGVSVELHGYNPNSKTFKSYRLFTSIKRDENSFLYIRREIEGFTMRAIDAFEQIQGLQKANPLHRLQLTKFEALFANLI
ncbi:hypothetical protein [Lelliottia wanjuensis]|uniref:hypothetical protein n=1 Tax=Lelliottia wanjuensis TaxID=3050585 RepID=UPI00254FBCDC|nr:hypothetical protein [Lelliottia sp. V86_10]MDK9585863.1 hypothetical protein [Lelliottia sp. V86_10]